MSKYKITIINGCLGRDAETKQINGNFYNAFTVAAECPTAPGHTEWFDCLKRVSGENRIASSLKKGTRVYIDGTPTFRAYTDRSGQTKVGVSILVDTLELLGGKQEQERATALTQDQVSKPAQAAPLEPKEDDLPF